MAKCKECKEKFEQKYFLQKFCMVKDGCIKAHIDYSKNQQAKKWRKKKTVLKEKLKTNKDYLKELQTVFNQIAREIDKDSLCLMCGTVPRKKNGCHYHSVGSNSSLRFNLFNIWLGCEQCNSFKSGNINGYDLELIKYYGRDKWEYIKFDLVKNYPLIKLSIPEIKEVKLITKEILKEVKNLPILTHEERWSKRKELNIKIGIYV